MLYAQPLTRSAELRTSDFRRRDGRLEAMFGRMWMPLDSVTAQRLRELHPSIGEPVSAQNRPLFLRKACAYRVHLERVVRADLKKVRLGALAAALRGGAANRSLIAELLGIAIGTIEYVEQTFPWDLQQTVAPEIVESRNRILHDRAPV